MRSIYFVMLSPLVLMASQPQGPSGKLWFPPDSFAIQPECYDSKEDWQTPEFVAAWALGNPFNYRGTRYFPPSHTQTFPSPIQGYPLYASPKQHYGNRAAETLGMRAPFSYATPHAAPPPSVAVGLRQQPPHNPGALATRVIHPALTMTASPTVPQPQETFQVAATASTAPQIDPSDLIVKAFLGSYPLAAQGTNLPFWYNRKTYEFPTNNRSQHCLMNEVLTLFWNECKEYVRQHLEKQGSGSALAKSFCKSIQELLFKNFASWKETWHSNLQRGDRSFQEMNVITSLISGEYIFEVMLAYLNKSAEACIESKATDYMHCTQLCFKPTEGLVTKLTELLDAFAPKQKWTVVYKGKPHFEEDDDSCNLEDWAEALLRYSGAIPRPSSTDDSASDDDGDEVVWNESFGTPPTSAA